MPAFVTLPPIITPRRGITAGLPSYSFGSFPLGLQPFKLFVSSTAVASNVVTLGVVVAAGNAPVTGNVVNISGTAAGPASINAASATLTGVSINAQGVGTITYSVTTPNLATTPDGGMVNQIVSDVGESVSAATKGLQFALDPAGGYGLTMVWGCPSAPASIALQMECSIDDIDAQYILVGASQTTTSGSVIAQVPNDVRFVRANATTFSGGSSPTMWVKFYQSTAQGM